MTTLDRSYQIIKKPVMSEKASDAMQVRNAYTFRVPLDANKTEIRDAVQRLFDVKVKSVNTLNRKGKIKRFRGVRGRRQDVKKAVVTLEEGQSIDVTTGL